MINKLLFHNFKLRHLFILFISHFVCQYRQTHGLVLLSLAAKGVNRIASFSLPLILKFVRRLYIRLEIFKKVIFFFFCQLHMILPFKYLRCYLIVGFLPAFKPFTKSKILIVLYYYSMMLSNWNGSRLSLNDDTLS